MAPASVRARHLLGVQIHVVGHHLHQPLGVGRVVDGEAGPDVEVGGLGPQDAYTHRVEGGDPHGSRPGPDHVGHPLAHLSGGLVGERDGQDFTGVGTTGGQQIGDPAGQHPGLARPGPGHHQQRSPAMLDGGPLLRVQPAQQLLGLGVPGLFRALAGLGGLLLGLGHQPLLRGQRGGRGRRSGEVEKAVHVVHQRYRGAPTNVIGLALASPCVPAPLCGP